MSGNGPIRTGMVLATLVLASTTARAVPVAFDMVGSASQNLTSFSNPVGPTFSSPGDAFDKLQRFVSPSIPFSVLDDSLSIFPPDNLGIIREGNTDEFFGVVDTENLDNTGPVSATWTFDVSGVQGLSLAVDMGAMGDFEANDFFEWTYSIDGGPAQAAFASAVDEAGSLTYSLEGGSSITLNDPMLVNGTVLDNNLRTLSAPISGTGSSLSVTLTAQTNGGTEAIAFQNLVVDGTPIAGREVVAFDMVDSASLNLSDFSNPVGSAFSSPGDAFDKLQRFVSPSIPFSLLDDSLNIFPPDNLGIIREGNIDQFFGVVDTENADNTGPVSASWTFDISGFEDLELAIDIGAMGDFEANDFFEWTYQIDGGPVIAAFSSTVDEAGSQIYTLEGGSVIALNDPMVLDGVLLSNLLQTFTTAIAGTGSSLLLTLSAQMNGGTEALAFQNLVITGRRSTTGIVPAPGTLALLALGLMGLRSRRAPKRG